MLVSDVMTQPVLTVSADAAVEEAVRMMLDHGISGLPVTDATGETVGIITEGDFLRRVESGTERHRARWLEFLLGPGRMADEYTRTHGRKVAEVMTHTLIAVAENTPLEEAVHLMELHHVKRLPVLRGRRVVGIISRANLLRALVRPALRAEGGADSDGRIRTNLQAELDRQAWAPRTALTIDVKDGVVSLSGVIFDDRQRDALRVAAENIPGVVAVRDRLVWIEPNSGYVIDAPDDAAGTAMKSDRARN